MLLLTVVGVVVAVLLLRCVAHAAHVAHAARVAHASLLLPSRRFEGRRFVAIRRVIIPKKLLNRIFCKD